MGNGKPVHRSVLIHDDDFTIMSRYQAEFRGVVQYYLLALNVSHFGKLQWVMGQSLAKTLAAKHKTSTRKMVRRYKSTVQTELGNGLASRSRYSGAKGNAHWWHSSGAYP